MNVTREEMDKLIKIFAALRLAREIVTLKDLSMTEVGLLDGAIEEIKDLIYAAGLDNIWEER